MSKQLYSKEQMKELLNNKYVKSCTSKYITFTDEFKIKALELDKKYINHRRIFKDFWFPEYIIESEIPCQSMKNWRRKIKNKWLTWLVWTKKWRKKKERINVSKMTLEEQNDYLKTKVAYLEELHKSVYWHYP